MLIYRRSDECDPVVTTLSDSSCHASVSLEQQLNVVIPEGLQEMVQVSPCCEMGFLVSYFRVFIICLQREDAAWQAEHSERLRKLDLVQLLVAHEAKQFTYEVMSHTHDKV